MGDLVNLRQVKKARAKAERSRLAEANRAAFGQSKTDKAARAAAKALAERRLDQAKRAPDTLS